MPIHNPFWYYKCYSELAINRNKIGYGPLQLWQALVTDRHSNMKFMNQLG